MNNDIVVKQKPGTPQPAPPVAEQSSEASQSQTATIPEADKLDPLKSEMPAKNPAPKASSPKPVGVILMAVLISLCLITTALYIGYNQS